MGSSDKKSKKDRKRSRSRSRERSRRRRDSSSDSSRDYDKKSDDHRRKKDGSKKADKEKMKALETPEEKRARRLAKKMKKEEKRAASKGEGYLPSSVTYTNLDNPFNDPHLADTFVWKKKLDEEGRPVKKRDIEKETRERVQRNLREMDELKRNRDSRLAAREEMDMMKREEEKAAYGDWDQKEAQFQLQQAKLRSKIRIEQNRPKPIDLLIRYIDYAEEPSDLSEKERQEEFELEEPSKYIRGLSYGDYEDLFEDFKICKQIDAGKNADYWSDIQTLADEEFRKLKNTRQQSATQAVQGDIDKRMKGKTMSELIALKNDVEKKLRQRDATTIVAYWEEILQKLTAHIAKQRIRELHRKMLDLKLRRIKEQMKDENVEEAEDVKPEPSEKAAAPSRADRSRSGTPEDGHEKWNRPKINLESLEDPELDEQEREQKWKQLLPEELQEATVDLYEKGGYSPTYGDPDDAMPGIEVLYEADDMAKLLERREKNRKKPEAGDDADAAMLAMARRGMDKDEGTFSVEVPIEAQKHLWSDKYRPRKPRYLNRVQTGFEWNKYNQTHYDVDNPPPKVVQGYKFNVFYPDLLDPTIAPNFKIYEDADPDFATIRFKAGPPYEDIAFKVVNREWDVLHKNGYKCQFQQGVFQLWFSFKKYRYRR